jgi:predicted kinase
MVLRSDEVRKQLCGVPFLERLGPDGYSLETSQRVYATLAQRAASVVTSGHSVVVDAVYARPSDRHVIEDVAARASVPFVGVWLEAPESVLIARAERRINDPSDADASVVRSQHRERTGLIDWHRIDASASPAAVLRSVVDMVQAQHHEAINAA